MIPIECLNMVQISLNFLEWSDTNDSSVDDENMQLVEGFVPPVHDVVQPP